MLSLPAKTLQTLSYFGISMTDVFICFGLFHLLYSLEHSTFFIVLAIIVWGNVEVIWGCTPAEFVWGIRLKHKDFQSPLILFFKFLLRLLVSFSYPFIAILTKTFIEFPAHNLGRGLTAMSFYLLNLLIVSTILGFSYVSLHDKFVKIHQYKSLKFAFLLLCFLGVVWLTPLNLRTDLSSVKGNMHTVQTIVETYAQDSGGFYPESVEVLKQEASTHALAYWRDFANPATGKIGLGYGLRNETDNPHGLLYLLGTRGMQDFTRGMVSYQPSKDFKNYAIYGYDGHGNKILYRGQILLLSNG